MIKRKKNCQFRSTQRSLKNERAISKEPASFIPFAKTHTMSSATSARNPRTNDRGPYEIHAKRSHFALFVPTSSVMYLENDLAGWQRVPLQTAVAKPQSSACSIFFLIISDGQCSDRRSDQFLVIEMPCLMFGTIPLLPLQQCVRLQIRLFRSCLDLHCLRPKNIEVQEVLYKTQTSM